MWSGPRNLSTALLRAFENRPDTEVVDEPFYACYLAATALEHPGREQILASQSQDWDTVMRELSTAPVAAPVQYQKQMTQHLLAAVPDAFADGLCNAFLIREPARIIASYLRVRPLEDVAELGLDRQFALFQRCCERDGSPPPVVDAALLLDDPLRTLRALCARLGIPFADAMLAWPAGPRDSDGVWAPHWYAQVWSSTGFSAPENSPLPAVPDRYRADLERLQACYRQMLSVARSQLA
jgi:hypothetical protein